MSVPVTQDFIDRLQAAVASLIADKAAADAATSASNQAQSALTAAQSAASDAAIAEASADGVVSSDLVSLQHLVDALVAPPATPPAV